MSKELATTNALAGLEGLGAGLKNTIKGAPTATDFTALKLKNGRWIYGAANTQINKKSTWLFDPRTVEHGWICWKQREQGDTGKASPPLGERMVPFSQPKPLEADLPFFAEGRWDSQYLIKVTCFSGDEAGTELLYKSSADGMQKELVKLLVAIEQRILAGEEAVFPVVKLRYDDYNHPTWGQTFTPVFKIVDWLKANEIPTLAAPDEKTSDDEPQKKKKKKGKKNKTIDAEPVDTAESDTTAGGGETEAPQMRRRRRA